jgi:hypothetical protein
LINARHLSVVEGFIFQAGELFDEGAAFGLFLRVFGFGACSVEVVNGASLVSQRSQPCQLNLLLLTVKYRPDLR